MEIPIINNVRGIIFTSIIILGFGFFITKNNSKKKEEYSKSTGYIEYFDKKTQNLPPRHEGDFRYLKINSYSYLFEIYEPNSEKTKMSIDDLKVGNKIDIYYYETSDTQNSELNRFTQFIDKEGKPYFIRNGFQMQLGFVVIGLSIFMIVMAFGLWKIGKLNW